MQARIAGLVSEAASVLSDYMLYRSLNQVIGHEIEFDQPIIRFL